MATFFNILFPPPIPYSFMMESMFLIELPIIRRRGDESTWRDSEGGRWQAWRGNWHRKATGEGRGGAMDMNIGEVGGKGRGPMQRDN